MIKRISVIIFFAFFFIVIQGLLFSADAADYGYINYTDIIVTHPLMKLWDNKQKCFIESRHGKRLSRKKIIEREQFFWKLEKIKKNLDGLIPYINFLRSNWQAENPGFTFHEFKEAMKSLDNIYLKKKESLEKELLNIEKKISAAGWTKKEMILNRKKSPERVISIIVNQINKISHDFLEKYNLQAILNSSCLNNPFNDAFYHVHSGISLSNTQGNIYLDALSHLETNELKINNLVSWYNSRDYVLRSFKTTNPKGLLIENGIDLTSKVLVEIKKIYSEK